MRVVGDSSAVLGGAGVNLPLRICAFVSSRIAYTDRRMNLRSPSCSLQGVHRMRCIGQCLVKRRFWQSTWLAAVLLQSGVLSCCAAADPLPGDGEQQILSAERLHGLPRADGDNHREDPGSSSAYRWFDVVGCSQAGEGIGVVLKGAWPPRKLHLRRRGGERWLAMSLDSFVAVPPGWVLSASSVPRAPGILSAEYALLRRLEL